MSYGNAIRDELFARLGVYVKWYYELEGMKGTLDGLLDDAIEAFNIKNAGGESDLPSEADKSAYETFSAEIRRGKDTLTSLRAAVVSQVSDFVGYNVKELMSSPYTNINDILDELVDAMEDASPSDTVEENRVSLVAVEGQTMFPDPENSVGADDALNYPTQENPTQLAHADQFGLVCSDASVVNQEQWIIYSGRLGQFGGQVPTYVEVYWEAAGISKLKVDRATPHDGQGDGEGELQKVNAWSLTGAVKGSNLAVDGRAYLRFNAQGSFSDDNDELGQLSDWDLTAPVFGEDTDANGKMYASVVKEPASAQVLGGTMAVLDESSIILDDVDDSNTNDGTIYVTVEQEHVSGDLNLTVSLYSDAARSALEASKTVTAVTEFPVEFELVPAGGGISGRITLNAFNSTQDETDSTIIIKVPKYYVRVYASAGRSQDDLFAEGVSYVPKSDSPGVTLYLPGGEGPSYEAGSVALNYIEDNEGIVLTVGYYTVDLFKAVPGNDEDIVARAGSFTNLLQEEALGLKFYPVNGSGLENATVDLSGADVAANTVISAKVGYAAGDKFSFGIEVFEDGLFQTFLRDTYGKSFPSAPAVSATILDPTIAGTI